MTRLRLAGAVLVVMLLVFGPLWLLCREFAPPPRESPYHRTATVVVRDPDPPIIYYPSGVIQSVPVYQPPGNYHKPESQEDLQKQIAERLGELTRPIEPRMPRADEPLPALRPVLSLRQPPDLSGVWRVTTRNGYQEVARVVPVVVSDQERGTFWPSGGGDFYKVDGLTGQTALLVRSRELVTIYVGFWDGRAVHINGRRAPTQRLITRTAESNRLVLRDLATDRDYIWSKD